MYFLILIVWFAWMVYFLKFVFWDIAKVTPDRWKKYEAIWNTHYLGSNKYCIPTKFLKLKCSLFIVMASTLKIILILLFKPRYCGTIDMTLILNLPQL